MISRRRSLAAFAGVPLLAGCTARFALPGPEIMAPEMGERAFVMPDGARLPYREWLPIGQPRAAILALHGFNDSSDAWELPAPLFAAAGYALIAPDQRGFGAASGRGLWPGTHALVEDARHMALLVRRRFTSLPLVLMGESMGGAALLVLAGSPRAPVAEAWVFIAPAIWGWSKLTWFERAALWVAAELVPGWRPSGASLGIRASDNEAALIRLSQDPLTIHATRMDTLRGLVHLMSEALGAAGRFRARGMFLYGEHDEVVPKRAMAAAWRALPVPETLAFYPHGYHLLLRDHDRQTVINDILFWLREPGKRLPSGADVAAVRWLMTESRPGRGFPASAPGAIHRPRTRSSVG